MLRHGAIVLADVIGKLNALEVACDKCVCKGRYAVARLIEQRGRDAKVIDWPDAPIMTPFPSPPTSLVPAEVPSVTHRRASAFASVPLNSTSPLTTTMLEGVSPPGDAPLMPVSSCVPTAVPLVTHKP
jgi:hypothetical protein